MKKRLDNKGFTLVELLAVLVILIAIMSIAIPSISSSLERSKDKQNNARIRILESAAELFVTDYKNKIYNNLGGSNVCYITISQLKDKGYVSDEDAKDSNDKNLSGNIVFNKSDNSYKYGESIQGVNPCVSG